MYSRIDIKLLNELSIFLYQFKFLVKLMGHSACGLMSRVKILTDIIK